MPLDLAMGSGPEGRQRLLAAAVRHLGTSSEADLRVTDIAAEADVAIGLIRHHFGSRDGLVSAAQQVRLEGAVRNDLAQAEALLGSITDAEGLRQGMLALTRALLSPDRRELRLARVAAIAAAHGRPELRAPYEATIGALLDQLSAILLDAQRAGLVRSELDPRALATFIHAYALGIIVSYFDPTAPDDEALTEVIMTALTALLIAD
jgi:AcrR family transcriptional regulator